MPTELMPLSLTPLFDNAGYLQPQAQLFFYEANTLTPMTVYQDHLQSVAFSQPVITSLSGRIPPIYVNELHDYRVRILDAGGELLEDIPWLPKARNDAGEEAPGQVVDSAINGLFTGDIIAAFTSGIPRVGFVRANGGTIGNASSGATERANADAEALFTHLWNNSTADILPVTTSGGVASKGSSAAADWGANKRIEVPNLRNRFPAGSADMGRGDNQFLSTAVSGVVWARGDHLKAGSVGGAAAHQLTLTQIPAHTHGLNNHTHTFSIASNFVGVQAGSSYNVPNQLTTGTTGGNVGQTLPGPGASEYFPTTPPVTILIFYMRL